MCQHTQALGDSIEKISLTHAASRCNDRQQQEYLSTETLRYSSWKRIAHSVPVTNNSSLLGKLYTQVLCYFSCQWVSGSSYLQSWNMQCVIEMQINIEKCSPALPIPMCVSVMYYHLGQKIETIARTGVQASVLSSMHVPVWHAWLSRFFGQGSSMFTMSLSPFVIHTTVQCVSLSTVGNLAIPALKKSTKWCYGGRRRWYREMLLHGHFWYSHFRLVRTRLTRNFGLHAQKPLVQNQIALTHILYGFG